MISTAFTPQAPTVAIAASTVASTPVQISAPFGPSHHRIVTKGGLVFLAYGTTSAEASTNAAVIAAGGSGKAIPMLDGTDEILSFPPGTWFAVIMASGTAVVYITPGIGI